MVLLIQSIDRTWVACNQKQCSITLHSPISTLFFFAEVYTSFSFEPMEASITQIPLPNCQFPHRYLPAIPKKTRKCEKKPAHALMDNNSNMVVHVIIDIP